MEQQNLYKILAALMILTMIIVPVAYVITSPRSDYSEQKPEQTTQTEQYNPEFWTVNQPFYSISDALEMSPPGIGIAYYIDTENMPPQMIQNIREQEFPLINEVDEIYKTNTTKMYYARIKEGQNESFLLLSTMFPEKNDFEYMKLPDANIPILVRQDQKYNGMYNILGNPAIFAPPQTAVAVLNIIYNSNKTITAYDKYKGLLSKVEPVPFQRLNSTVKFADQFYMGIKPEEGNYEVTAAYLNLKSTNLKRLSQIEKNSTQMGFIKFNLTSKVNYTIVNLSMPAQPNSYELSLLLNGEP